MSDEINFKEIPLCTQCAYVITNPICPRCFSQHVLYWLRDKKISEEEANKILKGIKSLIRKSEDTPSDIKCIVCSSEKVNLCVHCFTLKAWRVLQENTNKEIVDNFDEDFNTKIWRL